MNLSFGRSAKASFCCLTLLVLVTPFERAAAQAVESMQERRAKEAEEAKRKHTDDVMKHAQTWNRSKEQNRASKFVETRREQREQRLNEIAYIYGDLLAELPQTTALINRPYPSEFELIGKLSPKYDLDSDIVGGIALKLNVKKARKGKPERVVIANTIAPIKQGDVLCLTFWARAAPVDDESNLASLPELGVRRAAAPHGPLAKRSVSLTESWEHFSFSFTSPDALSEAQAQVYFKLGDLKQKLELGPAYLFNLGPVQASTVTGKACRA